jgi:DDE family transposase
MTRRLLQAVDPDLLATAIGAWLAEKTPAPASGSRPAVAVDGNGLRGSRTRNGTARHVLAAADQPTGAVLASTTVDIKTNEITRFASLLDQLNDLRGVVVTADALHCQRRHVAYLAGAGRTPTPVGLRHRRVGAAPEVRPVPGGDTGRQTSDGRPRMGHTLQSAS